MRSKRLLITSAMVLASLSPCGWSQTLDQAQTDANYAFWFEATVVRWQEFVPTLNNVAAVDLLLERSGGPGTVIVEIATVGGVRLGISTIPQSAVPGSGWATAEFDPPVAVTPGQTYRIYVSADADSPSPSQRYYWRGTTTSSYCPACRTDVAGGWPGFDYAFRTWAESSGAYETALYLLSHAGVHRVSLDGHVQLLVNDHKESYGLKIWDGSLYVTQETRGEDLVRYSLNGDYIESIPTPSQANDYLTFVPLPGGRFALLDNRNDKVFFIDGAGHLLATALLRPAQDSHIQNIDGVVVGDRLIVSEDGDGRIMQIDLTAYTASVFKDLSTLPTSPGPITYADGTYYVCGASTIYRFTEVGVVAKVADVPSSNITGIAIVGDSAYVCVNSGNKIYKVSLGSGAVDVLASGLDYPVALAASEGACASTGQTGHFELCKTDGNLTVPDHGKACWKVTEPWLLTLPGAPTWAWRDAVVTKVEYRVVVRGSNVRCRDYEISIDRDPADSTPGVLVYDNRGGSTDGGYDDDVADDADIELDWRETDYFNGQSVHDPWSICIEDTASGHTGYASELCLRITWTICPTESCGFTPGDRVTLLVSNPNGAVGLPAGTEGTVICCHPAHPFDRDLFVSWDGWTNGMDAPEGYMQCFAPPLPCPPNSVWGVSCSQVAPAGEGSGPSIVICIGGSCFPLLPDPIAPPSSHTYLGSAELKVELNFRGQLTAEVTPIPAINGTWTAWLDPDVVGPGTVTTTLWVRGENLNLAALPGGSTDVQVGTVAIFVVPVF